MRSTVRLDPRRTLSVDIALPSPSTTSLELKLSDSIDPLGAVGDDMDGKRGEVLKFELRGVVLRVKDDGGEWLAYVPYSKIGTVENFDRAIDDA